MSTILKALRRLEEEKARGGAPRPLREEVASGPGEQPRRRGAPWTLLGALVLGASLGASAWWFWPYERAGAPQEVAVADAALPSAELPAAARIAPPGGLGAPGAPAEAAVEPAPPSEPEALEAEAGSPPDDAFASLVEVVQRPPAEPRIAPVAPKPDVSSAAPGMRTERPVALARKRARQRAAAAEAVALPAPPAQPAPSAAPPAVAAVEPPPRPAPAPVAAAPAPPKQTIPADDRDWPLESDWETSEPESEPAPARSESARSPVTFAASSDPSFGAEVRVKRTQWHPEHARRSAELVLAGKDRSVREGDVVGDYVVNEIRPSGVVLTRDGEQIERGIGAK